MIRPGAGFLERRSHIATDETNSMDKAQKGSAAENTVRNLRGFSKVTGDVTDQQGTGAALRSVVDHVIDGIITIDEQGMVKSFNPAAERIFGYVASDVIGQNVKMLMPDPYHPEHDGYLGNYLRTGEAKIIGIGREVVGRRKDGSPFPMDLAVSTFCLAESRLFTGIVRDITERKRLERDLKQRLRELAQAEERMRSVVDHVMDGVITIDARGKVETFNLAAERIFGYAATEVIGHNVKMLMPDPYHAEHDEYLKNYLSSGQAKIIGIGRQVVGRRKDGSTFPMDLAVSTFCLNEFCFFTGIVRDITERKRLEQQLHERVQELAEADRRKDRFLATLAHELRNPLAPILNAVELLSVKDSLEQDLQWASGIINRQVRQMVHLIDDLLDISRISRGKVELRKQRVELAAVVNSAIESSRPLIEDMKHSLTITLPDQPIYLEGDPTRLAQVLLNLLNNAAKFTPSGGHIGLTVERDCQAAVLIRLRDTGIGIAPDMLSRIFEMFTQVESSLGQSQDGLGIGLSLVRGLIELHGGIVEAHSAGPGQGSEFIVRLPLSAEEPQHPAISSSEQVKKFPAQRILLVDDNKDAADGLARIFESLGQKVWVAYDGPSALETVSAPQPNMVLCDIGMSGMNGYDVARKLRENPSFANLVLIAVTGWGQEEDRRRSQDAGFNAHIVKPATLETLQELLNTWSKEPQKNVRLLIADDNRDEADVLSLALRREGFEVQVAHDGEQAITMALQFKPDVLFLDIAMPILDGFQVAQRLRAMPDFTNKVFVALTGFSDQEHLDQASSAEFDEYLVKPFKLDRLMTILAEASGCIG